MSTTWTPALEEAHALRDDVREAAGGLERALAGPATAGAGQWARKVGFAASALREVFAAHIDATECADGLFSEVMARSPRVAHRIAQLRDDHLDIRHRLDDLIVGAQSASESEVASLRDQGLTVLERIARHRHRGSELIYEAYLVDIEAGD